ncbi:uncharacterized protein RCC_08530 [Ramularia collo-cygni]|uniref:Uncharacterized protein n=1 Tax=Ramularia collo-cygni TaxID=112498 RepID=A0A2D3VKE8_9PEZI|nr:uncharacterized protein RCC_08530 [Ramularia collo-cygni]CZT22824.1 uncharacterized protein RCC_08530 [Ramularia collo-cygni]
MSHHQKLTDHSGSSIQSHDFLIEKDSKVVELYHHECSLEIQRCENTESSSSKAGIALPVKPATTIAASNQSYDLVVLTQAAYESMAFLQRPAMLKKALRVLRLGGCLLLESSLVEMEDWRRPREGHALDNIAERKADRPVTSKARL